jgi:hypothetical protein
MADNTDNISMDNFSIQGTMEMGMGNQELLNDLFSPETSTSDPDDVTPIIKDAEPATPPAKPAVPKGKEITPTEDDDDEKTKAQSAIANFLGDNDDDDEEDDDAIPSAPANKSKAPASQDDEDDDEPQGTQFTALANDLFKLGVFNKDEDDDEDPITTPEEFLERFEIEKKRGASEMVQNFIGQFGEDYQQAFEAIFVKGVNPKDYFGTYNEVINFAEMDLSEERNQITIMKQALADQGFEHDDIDSEIERLQNYGDLENVATKHHKVLVKKEAQKLNQMEAKAEKELQQKAAVRNQYIQNVQGILGEKLKSKEFDGIPLNPKLANELQDFLLVDKWKTTSGELLSDFDRTILDLKRPENHAMKVKVGLLLKILEKDPTLSTIQKSGVSKKTDQLFGEVARQVTKTKTSGSGSGAKPNSWFNNL